MDTPSKTILLVESGLVFQPKGQPNYTITHGHIPIGTKRTKPNYITHAIVLKFIEFWFGKPIPQLGDKNAELAVKSVCSRIRTSKEEVAMAKTSKTFCVPELLFLNGALHNNNLRTIFFHAEAAEDTLLKNHQWKSIE